MYKLNGIYDVFEEFSYISYIPIYLIINRKKFRKMPT